MTRFARIALLVLLYFGALSAIGGGILGTVDNGGGVPLEHLRDTPFTSYLIPSLILGIVIGGTQGAAAILLHRRNAYSSGAATVAGFGMMIWIFVELAIIGYDVLQTLYFGLGALEVLLVLGLVGALGPAVKTSTTQSVTRRQRHR